MTRSSATKVTGSTMAAYWASSVTNDTLFATNQRTASQPRMLPTAYILQEQTREIPTLYLHYTHAQRTAYGFWVEGRDASDMQGEERRYTQRERIYCDAISSYNAKLLGGQWMYCYYRYKCVTLCWLVTNDTPLATQVRWLIPQDALEAT